MKKARYYAATLALLGVTSLGLAACGDEKPAPTPIAATATSVPPTNTAVAATDTAVTAPATSTSAAGGSGGTGGSSGTGGGQGTGVITQAQQAMLALNSYHFTMSIAAGTAQSFQAEGDYQKPDRIRISMDMGQAGKFDMVMIDKDVYTKMGSTDSYVATQSDQSVAQQFNPNQFAAFSSLAQNVQVVGDDTVDGVSTTHVTFTYDMDAAAQQQAQASGAPTPSAKLGTTTADMWVEKSTNYIRQFKFTNPIAATGTPTPGAATESVITVIYSKFNEAINPPIEKPANVMTPVPDLTNIIPGALTAVPDAMTAIPAALTAVPTP